MSTFSAGKKETLDALVARIYSAFLAGGDGVPSLRFSFIEGPIGAVSSVDRVLKRFPELARFMMAVPTLDGAVPRRALSNLAPSAAAGEQVPVGTLVAIAAGSWPFRSLEAT